MSPSSIATISITGLRQSASPQAWIARIDARRTGNTISIGDESILPRLRVPAILEAFVER